MSLKKDRFNSFDKNNMRFAINLAINQNGLTGTNPSVGCVIVKNKNIIKKVKCRTAIIKAKKLMGKKGRVLVRKSGTEPKIRIMSESEDKSLNKLCVNIIKKSIQ